MNNTNSSAINSSRLSRGMRLVALLLAVCTMVTSLPLRAESLSVAELTAPAGAVSARAHLQALLAREDVQAGLAKHGVSADAAAARVAALSDEEAVQLSQRMDSLPAGGSVLGVIVFIFLVLLVTDILGLTKVFPFTRPIR